jgi:surface polysaccharide O-acyltransferase-like enzyme
MQNRTASTPAEADSAKSIRLHYLDWLRVIATLGVFLFHASNVFNTAVFEIKNAQVSETIMIIQAFFFPWGMPLFFMVAGAGSWFALRRRSASQFTRERTLRLLVPFFTGTILLGPIQLYLSWLHRTQTGVFDGSLLAFTVARFSRIGPKLFGAVGYHMWFLGFLFAYSLLALPLFMWVKGEKGRKAVSRLAAWCKLRGAILIFILPPIVVRLGLHPFFPVQNDWADFFSHGTFFVLGFLMFSDERFTMAIRRDGWILLGVGMVAIVAAMAIGMSLEAFDIEKAPTTVWEFAMWGLVAACGWCWTAFMLFVGMRFMDRDNKLLRYSLGAILPFFVVHQPVILAIAYFVVQWEATLPIKLLVVVLGSFLVSIGIYEWGIKRVGVLRRLFGMKGGQPAQVARVVG